MGILNTLTALELEQLRYIVERVPEWPEGHDGIWTSSVGYICAIEPYAGMYLFEQTSWDFEQWPTYSPDFTRAQYDAMRAELAAPAIDYRAHCEALAGALESCLQQLEVVLPKSGLVHDERQALIKGTAALTRWKEDSK